jgi:hypothetical protein
MAWNLPSNPTPGSVVSVSGFGVKVVDCLSYLKAKGGGENPKELPIMAAQAPLSKMTAAAVEVVQTGGGTPSPQWYQLRYDGTVTEGRMWNFNMPSGYVDTPQLIVQYNSGTASASGGTIIWGAQLAAINNGDSGLNNKEFAAANMGTVVLSGGAWTNNRGTISLSNADSVVAGDQVCLVLYRSGASDSFNNDAVVNYVGLSYNV